MPSWLMLMAVKVFSDELFERALPLTATVAIRGASASIFSQQLFFYDSVDPATGAPVGRGSCSNRCSSTSPALSSWVTAEASSVVA